MNHYFPGIGIITLIMEQTPDSAQPTPDDYEYSNPGNRSHRAEAPSPAPVIPAQEIIKYTISCFLENNIIELKIKDNLTNVSYKVDIDSDNGRFWLENKKYFQEDFKKFHKLLKSCFEGNNDNIKSDIKSDNPNKLQIVLQYDGLFGFTVEIDVPKEEDEIDLLKKEINDLKEDKKKIEKKVNDLCDFVNHYMTSKKIMEKCPRKRERATNGDFIDIIPCIVPSCNSNSCYCTRQLNMNEVMEVFSKKPEYWKNVKTVNNWDI
tara:strand:+ start:2863 stop:3651 length:789 start_codon:yes stop_codon:yes gene_type:complete